MSDGSAPAAVGQNTEHKRLAGHAALITGAYPIAYGTEHMRSSFKIPDEVGFYPGYLREAGYYTSNNYKKDYNFKDI